MLNKLKIILKNHISSIKKPSLGKIEHKSIFGSSNSATLPYKNDSDKIDSPSLCYNSSHNIWEEKRLSVFSLNKRKNIKLAPLKTKLPSTLNNENHQPLSANYSSQSTSSSKHSYLRKSIFAAHKIADEQMKKEQIKKNESDFEEIKGEFFESFHNELKKENQHRLKNIFDDNEKILNPKNRLSQGKKDNFIGVTNFHIYIMK